MASQSKFNNAVFRNAAAQLIKNVQASLDEIGAAVVEETDKNFRTKSFFGTKWKTGSVNQTTLVDSGTLRASIRVLQRRTNSIKIGSDLIYSEIHNRGGKFRPTARQKAYFWAMYKQTNNPVYKASALKVQSGRSIEIPQRQFIGNHPQLTRRIKMIIYKNLKQKYG